MDNLTITRPDDWHVHLRDGEALTTTVPDACRCFSRGIVMPNLARPVVNTEQALAYRQRILAQLPADSDWQPLMVLYLTDNMRLEEIDKAVASGYIFAVKYYPAGATTNSDSGVTDLANVYPVLERMQKNNLPLLLHGEVTDPEVDVYDREAVFIDRHLEDLAKNFPALKIVLEHITTLQGVAFVSEAAALLAATITPQHLLFNRNQLLAGGIRPHYYCLPVLKRNEHQHALIAAATSGNPKFFLGTDSAPHARLRKETACGCAGCYANHAAIELYAEVFDRAGAMDKLEGFASHFGADFYGLPRNSRTVTLVHDPWRVPERIDFGADELVPLCAGLTLNWRLD